MVPEPEYDSGQEGVSLERDELSHPADTVAALA